MAIGSEVILQLCATAPAPCRDYHGLTITDSQVILNTWNISHGPHVYPRRQKSTFEDFPDDKYLQNDIRRIFGGHALSFCLHLATNDRNIQYLPTKLFLRILKYLAAQDILSLSQTSKIFFELCNTEAVWKIIFKQKLRRPITIEDGKSAENVGWKSTLMNKLSKKINVNNLLLKKRNVQYKNEKNNQSRKTVSHKQNNFDIIQNIKFVNVPKYVEDTRNIRISSSKEPININQLNKDVKPIKTLLRISSAKETNRNNYQAMNNIRSSSINCSRVSSAKQSNSSNQLNTINLRQSYINSQAQSHGKTLKFNITGGNIMDHLNNSGTIEKVSTKGILKKSSKKNHY